VRLFIERASAVQPSFALTPANARAVARLCRELDGIPLALELAAARAPILSAEQLVTRLDDRFRLLTGGSRTALPRQQTLRATIDWSYGLLTPAERLLFARLAVFAGGWTLEAAEAVGAGAGVATEEVADLLTRLVEKSLVTTEALEDGGVRHRLLETLRQYGRARLETSGEPTPARRRHAAYYLALAERAEPELTGPDQLRWLDRLEREHDNLRAALAWWLERAERGAGDEAAPAAAAGLRLAGALFWFWFIRDHHPEALAWLDRALALGAAAPAAVRAKALFGAGVFAWSANDLARSEALLAESAALGRALGDRRALVLALGALGFTLGQDGRDEHGAAAVEEGIALAWEAGEPWLLAYALLHRLLRVAYGPAIARVEERARARAAGAEARPLFRATGDAMSVAEVDLCLGELALRDGDYDGAKAALRAAVPTMRAVGWRTSFADGLVRLGDVARTQGDVTEATSLYRQALALYRQSGRRLGANLLPHIPAVLGHLAGMALARGDRAAAQAHVGECLTVTRDTRQAGGPHVPGALEVRAALAAVQGEPRRALRLAGAAAARRAELDQPPTAAERAALERRLAPARRALSAVEQAIAWADGQGMTPEQAIADALA
jgi:non-specific serine/threonine protein kinase